MTNRYKYVFVILTYKSLDDLEDCLRSIKNNVKNYKIVIVNSYYDDRSKDLFKQIANNNDCDFINIPNKGYGYGNNRGIEYISNTYGYEWLIISNPDIIIQEFDNDSMDDYRGGVVAPMIRTLNGKDQNPYWKTKNKIAEKLVYLGYKRHNLLLLYVGIGVYKIARVASLHFFNLQKKDAMKIYAAHGSFLLLHKDVIKQISPLFDEKMFLFSEEKYLAHIFEQRGINIIQTKKVKVVHKEDGSMKVSKIDENEVERTSVIYYYEKYANKNNG